MRPGRRGTASASRVRPLLIVSGPPFIADSAMAFGRSGSSSMYDRSAASASSKSVPAKQLPGSIEREEAARRQIEPLQRALDEVDDLAHEPVILVREQRASTASTRSASRRSSAG